jgi:hypothetical protein
MQSTLGNWKATASASAAALIFDLDAANFASVPVPSSAQFSGSNWLSFSPGVTIGAGAYTVEGWAYFNTANLPGVMLSTLTAGNGGFTLLISVLHKLELTEMVLQLIHTIFLPWLATLGTTLQPPGIARAIKLYLSTESDRPVGQ